MRFATRPPIMSLRLSKYGAFRVLLHLFCLLHRRHVRWHWAGIARELRLKSIFPSH
jgi:hypothetical protein